MSGTQSPPIAAAVTPIFSLVWNSAERAFVLSASAWLIGISMTLVVALILLKVFLGNFAFKNFEIDQADFGIGDQKFIFKPNMTDKQVAYAIWVELSTRKIGLPIDFDHDVISEIYDSWFNFFTLTRELVKGIPAQKVRRDSTQKIIRLSIEVLNEGLRPHLTRWQARFRHWYDRELRRYDLEQGEEVLDPQLIQAKFPKFEELKVDMLRVNNALIKYREKMHKLVLKD